MRSCDVLIVGGGPAGSTAAWKLRREGVDVLGHDTVRHIAADAEGFVIDGAFRSRWLIGAGGTRCPVYRTLFRELNPRASELQIVTLEHEIQYDWQNPDCHLWFFST